MLTHPLVELIHADTRMDRHGEGNRRSPCLKQMSVPIILLMLGALLLQLLCSPPYLRRNKIGISCIMLPVPSTTWMEKYATLVTVIFLSNVHEQAMAMQKFFLAL